MTMPDVQIKIHRETLEKEVFYLNARISGLHRQALHADLADASNLMARVESLGWALSGAQDGLDVLEPATVQAIHTKWEEW